MNTNTHSIKSISAVILHVFLLSIFCVNDVNAQRMYQDSTMKTNGKYPWGVGIKINTFGIGFDVMHKFRDNMEIRAGFSFLPFELNVTDNEFDVKKDHELKVGAVNILADYYFLKPVPKLHVTAGVLYNFTKYEISGEPLKSYQIGSYTVSPDQLGNLTMEITPNSLCPYLGIGFGHFISPKRKVSFNFNMGVVYQGPPKAELTASGMIEPTGDQDEIVEENIKAAVLYPVLSLQLSYRLF